MRIPLIRKITEICRKLCRRVWKRNLGYLRSRSSLSIWRWIIGFQTIFVSNLNPRKRGPFIRSTILCTHSTNLSVIQWRFLQRVFLPTLLEQKIAKAFSCSRLFLVLSASNWLLKVLRISSLNVLSKFPISVRVIPVANLFYLTVLSLIHVLVLTQLREYFLHKSQMFEKYFCEISPELIRLRVFIYSSWIPFRKRILIEYSFNEPFLSLWRLYRNLSTYSSRFSSSSCCILNMSVFIFLVLHYSWYFFRNVFFIPSQFRIEPSLNPMNHLRAESLSVEVNNFNFGASLI